jgi:hypothetical protein
MTTIKVAIFGVVDALLEYSTPRYVSYRTRICMYSLTRLCIEITALIRPQSIHNPVNTKLQVRGVKVVPADLSGPSEKLVELLAGSIWSSQLSISIVWMKRYPRICCQGSWCQVICPVCADDRYPTEGCY